jgi:hypothetical protein
MSDLLQSFLARVLAAINALTSELDRRVPVPEELRAGIHAAARGQELPTWNGRCPAGKHGLDHEGQPCDLCAAEAKNEAKPTAKKAKKR